MGLELECSFWHETRNPANNSMVMESLQARSASYIVYVEYQLYAIPKNDFDFSWFSNDGINSVGVVSIGIFPNRLYLCGIPLFFNKYRVFFYWSRSKSSKYGTGPTQ